MDPEQEKVLQQTQVLMQAVPSMGCMTWKYSGAWKCPAVDGKKGDLDSIPKVTQSVEQGKTERRRKDQ